MSRIFTLVGAVVVVILCAVVLFVLRRKVVPASKKVWNFLLRVNRASNQICLKTGELLVSRYSNK